MTVAVSGEAAATSHTGDRVVAIDHVTVTFPRSNASNRTVLDDVTFHVHRGELVVVTGRSGCGKTTLLNLIAGVVTPNGGGVQVHGRDPKSVRSQIGFMLARDALLPWRTARRNVEYGLEIRGVPRRQRRQRALSGLDQVELADAADLWPWQLSEGMRQRVALARTLALKADLLLMDEPFASLDAQTRDRIQQLFLEVWVSERQSVVFVTHDLDEAILLADRIVVISDGRIVAERRIPFARPRDRVALAGDTAYRDLVGELRALIT